MNCPKLALRFITDPRKTIGGGTWRWPLCGKPCFPRSPVESNLKSFFIMKLQRFPSKQVLVVGPGFSTAKLEKKLHSKNIPVVYTHHMVDNLLPDYKRLDVKKKALKWRPLIDRATDLVLSAHCLLNVPSKSLLVVDRVTAFFMSQTVNSVGYAPLFIMINDPQVLIERCISPSPLSRQLAQKWVDRCINFDRIYGPRKVVVDNPKVDLCDLVVVLPNHRGDLQWGLTELGTSMCAKGGQNV